MDISILPQRRCDILASVDAAHAAGPTAIANLAALCLWLYGQAEDLSSDVAKRDFLKRIESLLRRIAELDPGNAPELPFEYSHYPAPRLPQQPTELVPKAVAKEWVDNALQEITTACSPGHSRVLSREALLRLRERGVSKADLEPIIQLIIKQHKHIQDKTPLVLDKELAAEALMRIGAWERGLAIFDSFSAKQQAWLAKALIKTGRADLARSLLACQAEQVEHLDSLDTSSRLAEAWAYLGEETEARQLFQKVESSKYKRRLEIAVALGQYYTYGAADPTALIALLPATVQTELLQERLAEQSRILQALLVIGASKEIAQTLNYIHSTLLAPHWSFKYSLRLRKVMALLWQYREKYPTLLYQFIAQLLIDGGNDTHLSNRWDYVNLFVTVECLEWFIWYCAGPDQITKVADIVRSWHENL